MPLNPAAFALASDCVAEAGMPAFARGHDPAATGGRLVDVDLIDSFARAPGVPIFDKPDFERPGVIRSATILEAIRDGVPLPPIQVKASEDGRFSLYDGFHRLHLWVALGYTRIPVEVVPRDYP